MALQNLSIYHTQNSTRQKYKNNKLKIISRTWNDKFELLDGSHSVSNIQDYIEYNIKNTKHYPLILPFVFIPTGLIIVQNIQNKIWR